MCIRDSIHTVHETKVIEEQILDTHKIENFVKNFAEVYYSWEQSAASIDNRTNALKGYLTGELQALNAVSYTHLLTESADEAKSLLQGYVLNSQQKKKLNRIRTNYGYQTITGK